MTLKEKFESCCKDEESDIYKHLPVLYEYALKCNHITEFGTRRGNSTTAFLYACVGRDAKLICYDLERWDDLDELEVLAKDVNWEFIKGNTLEINIDQTDMLFIDTLHTGEQLFKELFLHADKVNKYIAFHDTKTYGDVGMNGGSGMSWAIKSFMENNPQWKEVYRSEENNGLLILEK